MHAFTLSNFRLYCKIILLSVVIAFFQKAVSAQVKLAAIFTDNMVLQQQSTVALWGWAQPGKKITVAPSWNKSKVSATVTTGGQWKVWLATPTAGGPYSITVSGDGTATLHNVLLGEVWLCGGQSNMEMPVKGFKGQPVSGSNRSILTSANSNLRLYTVPRGASMTPQADSKPSVWKEAAPESVSNFSATAYYFGKNLQGLLQVPVGLINVSYGGSPIESWMDGETLALFPEIKIPSKDDSIHTPNRTPTALYNAMLHPVIGYGIKGMIWYQGESNYDRADQYETLFPAAVQQWRNTGNQGMFPFYFAQIAPYSYAQLPPYYHGGKYNSAFLRDAQRKAVKKIPGSAMAVLLDAGEENNIHPADKQIAGERLSLLALAHTYRLKGFGADSPVYDKMLVANGIAEIKFQNAPNWLTSYGKQLSLFEIAGKDKVFHPAKAVIYRTSVMVSSPAVKEPMAVRYAFRDFTSAELYSTEGLPVSSFRTDDW